MPEATAALTLHFAPQSRAVGTLILLEELGVPYTLDVLDLRSGEQHREPYAGINPLGKVPAISHKGAVVTEQVAIYLYLADEFPQAGLAPPIGDPLRGSYLRWMAFYGSAFEPAMVEHSMKVEPQPMMSPYGTYPAVVDVLAAQMTPGPWVLGERFSALDVLWGTALGWMIQFGLVEKRPAFAALAERVAARPATERARAREKAILDARGT